MSGYWHLYFCPHCHAAFGLYKGGPMPAVCAVCKNAVKRDEWEGPGYVEVERFV